TRSNALRTDDLSWRPPDPRAEKIAYTTKYARVAGPGPCHSPDQRRSTTLVSVFEPSSPRIALAFAWADCQAGLTDRSRSRPVVVSLSGRDRPPPESSTSSQPLRRITSTSRLSVDLSIRRTRQRSPGLAVPSLAIATSRFNWPIRRPCDRSAS